MGSPGLVTYIRPVCARLSGWVRVEAVQGVSAPEGGGACDAMPAEIVLMCSPGRAGTHINEWPLMTLSSNAPGLAQLRKLPTEA